MPNLIKKVQNTVSEKNLFSRGDKIVLAVSGGPDSTAMLDIFYRLKEKSSLELIIAHVNYRLRGSESDKDEKLVRALAKKYDLKIFVLKPEIKSKSNLENNLREIRYRFFEKIRSKYNFDFIAVAHNKDDQIETFLMRVIRGSGLLGLSSIRYKNRKIIRPLLNISRQEILTYIKKNNLIFRIDKTNLESKFARNKIRNKLIPYIEKNFNPNISETIFNAIETIADDYDFINEFSSKKEEGAESLKVSQLTKLHPAIQRRLLLKIISEKKADLKNIGSAHIKELLKALKSTKGKHQTVVFKGLKAQRIGDKLRIERINK